MAQRDPAAPVEAPVKVSFSISKPSQRRGALPPKAPAPPSVGAVEYVTSVDVEAGVVVANPQVARGPRVVPKQEDSWRPEKRMKNIRLEADATRSTEETFEIETMDAGPKPNVVYGLTVMSRAAEGDGDGAAEPRPRSMKELEDQKLRDDLLNLPEEATLEKYEELPVEEFGEALLRGMGWEKGKPIGRNAKAVVEPFECAKREGRLGLGAVAAPPKEINRKYIKPGESRPKRPEVANGRPKNAENPDTRPVRRRVAKGKSMSIIAGPHSGRSGEVLSMDDDGGENSQVLVELVKSGERVVVYEDELADMGSLEEDAAVKKMGDLRAGNGKAERHSSRAEESRGERNLSENLREDEKHSKKSRRHREDEDERYSKRGHKDESHSRRGHKEESYSKRGHKDESYSRSGHKDEGYSRSGHKDENHSRRGHEDESHARRGHKDESYSRRGHEDESYSRRGHRQ